MKSSKSSKKSRQPADPMRPHSAFVLPSLIESFGLVYAEAMLMGLPCIGMKNNPPVVLSSSEDVIMNGRSGYVISDVDELVQRLDTLIEDEQLRPGRGSMHELVLEGYAFRWFRAGIDNAALRRTRA